MDVLLDETDRAFQTAILESLAKFWRQDFLTELLIEIKLRPPKAYLEEMGMRGVELIVWYFGVSE